MMHGQINIKKLLSLSSEIKVNFFLHILLGMWLYEGWNFNSGNYLFTTDKK